MPRQTKDQPLVPQPASPPPPPVDNHPNADPGDDIPEDWDVPQEHEVTGTTLNAEGQVVADNVNDLSGFTINEEQAASDREKLSAPTGDYTKRGRDPWKYTFRFNDQDKQKGDKSNKGRLIVSLTGPIENDDYKGIFSYTVSPDRRLGIDFETKQIDPNKFDGLYKRWLQAEEYYIKRTGETPKDVQGVVSILQKDDALILRVVKGREAGSSSFVMGFKQAE